MSRWIAVALLVSLVSCAGLPRGEVDAVSLGSLLEEMVDREALARLPEPAYTCKQFSSYDRGSVEPHGEGWMANGDRGHFLRVDESGARKEWVMMDADGPGAVVRIWSANPAGNLRVYVDGAAEPAIEAPMKELLGGAWEIAAPLSAERSKGWNLYLPIPYAEHCRITSDADDFYYQINYRTYAPGTRVESYGPDALAAERERLDDVQARLSAPCVPAIEGAGAPLRIAPGESARWPLPKGPMAIRALRIALDAPDLAAALRGTVLRMRFDGEETVWCPVGDFFGSGVGLNPFEGWWRAVREDGGLSCAWTMPYRRSAELLLANHGQQPVSAQVSFETGAWRWDARSLTFCAGWRHDYPLPTRPMRDWNYLDVEGLGVFAGDSLAVVNPSEIWWGEGDEKIYVDGERFPSHFGTGTEDYYGYAWCNPELFQAPFHAQPRCDGPGNYGHTTVSRVRALDAIPFERSLRFDMEVWHWRDVEVAYAATTYFYVRPGARWNRGPERGEVARGVIDPPPLPPPFAIEDALECEALEIVAQTEGITVEPQGGHEDGLWSGEQHLWVKGQQPGDFVELRLPVTEPGPQQLEVWATRSWDYGVVRFSVDGRPTGHAIDLYNIEDRRVAVTGPLDLGVHEPEGDTLLLRVEVVGGNPASEGTRAFFGLDCVRLTPAEPPEEDSGI